MKIVMHCNGGPEIGVGHVVRSVALAEEAVVAGHEVVVAGAFEGEFLTRLLAEVPVVVSQLGYGDADDLRRVVDALSPELVHLDAYRGEQLLSRGHAPFLSNMADGSFGVRGADLLIDPTFGAEAESAPVADEVGTLLRGSRYTPLRTAVTSRRGEWTPMRTVERLLVVMGGADPMSLTPRVLDLLAQTERPLNVTVISRNEMHSTLRKRARSYDNLDVEVRGPTNDLPALMVQQDLVISAAGTSVWELCCIGVPMALVCAVENQRAGYERVVSSGSAIGLGAMSTPEEVRTGLYQLRTLLDAPAVCAEMAARAARIVDGLGAWRVVRAWEQLTCDPSTARSQGPAIVTRPAAMADTDSLLRWRNDTFTRSNSRQQEEVDPGQHESWLRSSLVSNERLLLIASSIAGGSDVGTARWDQADGGETDVWEVSITVAPEHRGRGLGGPLLSAAEKGLRVAHPEVCALLATVHQDNVASRRLFTRAGYLLDMPADHEGFLRYRKLVRR